MPARKPAAPTTDVTTSDDAPLVAACERARSRHRPLLLDFGASWCPDCRQLASMKKSEPLASELAHFEVLDVDITEPEVHGRSKKAFDVRGIARWIVVEPDQCSAPFENWSVRASRVVEPTTDEEATSARLVAWLSRARG